MKGFEINVEDGNNRLWRLSMRYEVCVGESE